MLFYGGGKVVLVEPVGFSQNLPLFDTQHKPVRENINRSLTGSYSDHVGGDEPSKSEPKDASISARETVCVPC